MHPPAVSPRPSSSSPSFACSLGGARWLHFAALALAGCLALSAQTTVFEVSTFAGALPGSADGRGSEARFNGAGALALDPSGSILVLDRSNSTIRKVSPDGRVDTVLGVPGQTGSLFGPDVVLNGPLALATDDAGYIYLAHVTGIHRFTPGGVVDSWVGGGSFMAQLLVAHGGKVLWTLPIENQIWHSGTGGGSARLAGSPTYARGWADGMGDAVLFNFPTGIAHGDAGSFYVSDQFNYVIRRVDAVGKVTTFAGTPGIHDSVDGTGAAARFLRPSFMSADGAGNVYVVDGTTVRKLTPTGAVTTVAGNPNIGGNIDGVGGAARFHSVDGIVATPTGTLYVSDNNTIRKITPAGGVTTLAGVPTAGRRDGALSEARFSNVSTMVGGPGGALYVADGAAVRRIAVDGTVSTLAGSLIEDGSADGTGASARFGQLRGIAVDTSGNLYVTDERNHNVRRITPAGVVTTLAGKAGESGNVDGVAAVARFSQPGGLAIDANGNIYVADYANRVIRKITPGGVVSTIAGQAGPADLLDGVGRSARFLGPSDLAIDSQGNLWVADAEVVRKVSPGGQVTSLAGDRGNQDYWDGTGASARFAGLHGITVAPGGDLYVTDRFGYTVRRITPAGVVTTVAGYPKESGFADGRSGDARFYWLLGIWASGDGEIYVADGTAIRRISKGVAPRFEIQPQSATLPPGGNRSLSARVEGAGATYRWTLSGAEISGATNSSFVLSNLSPATSGLYAAKATRSGVSSVSDAAIVGVLSTVKALGAARELTPNNVVHPNGNTFDQVLLEGTAASITADANQVTRMSYIDHDGDIVQVEFSGPGTLSLVLDDASGPARPANYTQAVDYMTGHAGIVIVGADERTNVAVFTVGRATAFDPTARYNILVPPSETNVPANNGSPLFAGHETTAYDGIADIRFIAISSTNGKFGGVHTSNANYSASAGWTGVYAPGVAFAGPLYVGDITAFGTATPVIVLGSVGDARLTGGDLYQDNRRAVTIAGIAQLRFTAGTDSHGRTVGPRRNRGVLKTSTGQDVTSEVVVNAPMP